MSSCYDCIYYRKNENECYDVCVYRRITFGYQADDLPKNKGKYCDKYITIKAIPDLVKNCSINFNPELVICKTCNVFENCKKHHK
jgi:hypothetical protein